MKSFVVISKVAFHRRTLKPCSILGTQKLYVKKTLFTCLSNFVIAIRICFTCDTGKACISNNSWSNYPNRISAPAFDTFFIRFECSLQSFCNFFPFGSWVTLEIKLYVLINADFLEPRFHLSFLTHFLL